MDIDQAIKTYLAGPSNAGVRAEIRRVLAAPVDAQWPVPLASRVRSLDRSIAFTASGRRGLEKIASLAERLTEPDAVS